MIERPTTLEQFLRHGSVEAIASEITKRGIDWTGPSGQTAQLACLVLVLRQMEQTIKTIDQSAKDLQSAGIRLSKWALTVAGVALAVAVIQVLAAL